MGISHEKKRGGRKAGPSSRAVECSSATSSFADHRDAMNHKPKYPIKVVLIAYQGNRHTKKYKRVRCYEGWAPS